MPSGLLPRVTSPSPLLLSVPQAKILPQPQGLHCFLCTNPIPKSAPMQVLFLRKPFLTPGGGQDLLLHALEAGFLSHRALRSECNCVLLPVIMPFMSASPPQDNRLPAYKYFAYFLLIIGSLVFSTITDIVGTQ